ncbi:MAG: DUF6551 family protein [Sphingobium sp.]|uniref:DUF6551 family protein n=1 Tax=Sphingobium sp. TaxID=1912891 RepID=UPI003BAFCB63
MRGANYPTTKPPAKMWVYQAKPNWPEWLEPFIVEQPAANGTFLIQSRFGHSRVHPGNVIFDVGGHVYACPPSEVQRTVEELESEIAPVPPRQNDGGYPSESTPTIRAQKPQKSAINGTESTRPLAPFSSAQKPHKSAIQTRPADHFGTTPKKWPAAKGMPPSIENRSPTELNLDDSYQRSTDNGASQTLIKKIAHGWDWRMCLPLVVSKRDDGSLWVIDGQHRLQAAKLRGDIPFLPCCVAIYGSVAAEAEMFVAMNRVRKAMNRLDDFHAAIASGDPEAIEIKGIIEGAGFIVSRKTGSQSWVPGEVAFTSAIAKVLRKHGAKVCTDALTTMAEAFPDEVLNAGASMFTALTKLAINPPDGFDSDRMFRALLKRNQREWASFLNEVKGGGDERASALRQVLLMAYDEEAEIDVDLATGCADDALPGSAEDWRGALDD